ncbi:hypothetical protein HKX48_008649, partial [Thoreauomyces humboldtii]
MDVDSQATAEASGISGGPPSSVLHDTIDIGDPMGSHYADPTRSETTPDVQAEVARAQHPHTHKLRKRVKSVMHAHNLFESLRDGGASGRKKNARTPGAPPGVDVTRPNPELEALFRSEAVIRVVDSSATRVEFTDLKLHPLAVEDTFHVPQAIKADWYDNHIYVSMILCSIEEDSEAAALEAAKEFVDDDHSSQPSLADSMTGLRATPLFRNRIQVKVFDKMPSRPNVTVEQINIFLMRDGTMISIFQNDGATVTTPLYNRLEEQGTLIRNCEDTSFLLFSMMDIVTDHFFPILEAYKRQLDLLEAYVLQDPVAEATKELHLIAKELGILRRTLMPTRNLVASLRENGKALYVHSDVHSNVGATTAAGPVPAPFISKLTRTYLADVKDHVATVIDGLECFEGDARHLIDLIFNTVAHSTNEAMRTLALVSLIFLPISFLAGVFGMNFDKFPELHQDTNSFWNLGVYAFWIIVAGMVFVMLVAFKYMGW